jgi:hypothetical protein
VLSYHSRATSDEVESLCALGVPSGDPYGITTCAFDGSVLSDEETALATLAMFNQLGACACVDRLSGPRLLIACIATLLVLL